MRFTRRFTTDGQSAYDGIAFRTQASEIRNSGGKVVFAKCDVTVPADWSQIAVDILAQKYFRQAGVPAKLTPVAENDVPEFLWRRRAQPGAGSGGENDARQVFDRMAGCWTWWARTRCN